MLQMPVSANPSCVIGYAHAPRTDKRFWDQLGNINGMLDVVAVVRTALFLNEIWRRRPDLNRGSRFCRPLPYHLATAPFTLFRGMSAHPRRGRSEEVLERETGFEPATSTLARSHSTTELFPLA